MAPFCFCDIITQHVVPVAWLVLPLTCLGVDTVPHVDIALYVAFVPRVHIVPRVDSVKPKQHVLIIKTILQKMYKH